MKDDDFKLLRGFDNKLTDRRTFMIVESFLRLKRILKYESFASINSSFTDKNKWPWVFSPVKTTIFLVTYVTMVVYM